MTPLGWGWALFVWGYALAWFLVNDRVKLLAYRIFDPIKAEPSPSESVVRSGATDRLTGSQITCRTRFEKRPTFVEPVYFLRRNQARCSSVTTHPTAMPCY